MSAPTGPRAGEEDDGSQTRRILLLGALAATVLALAGAAVAAVAVIAPVALFSVAANNRPAAQAGQLPTTIPGIPAVVLDAYEQGAQAAPKSCGMRWEILAGIGQTESGHAEGRNIDADGHVSPPIYGPAIGPGGGLRAEGPMQFLPSSWTILTTGRWAFTGHSGATPDPQNVYDAAHAAANHLCSTTGSVATPEDLRKAIWGYNQSGPYVATVTSRIAAYDTAAAAAPTAAGTDTGADATASGLAAAAVAAAKSKLGAPYVFGAAGPNAYDCSSYVQMAYLVASHGKTNITRSTYTQIANTTMLKPVPMADLAPGDLIYIHVPGDAQSGWNHVVMFVGNGQIAEEPRPPLGARLMPADEYASYTTTARRVVA